jgi:tetratricopeptide (TPR) repeat protein
VRAAIALAILCACAAVAAADDAAPTPKEIKEARKHFDAGKALISKKQFADAIVELEAAYELDPRSDHLYNLGVAHQLNGEDGVAMQYYRLFLDDHPKGKTARNAERYLEDLEGKASTARADRRARRADEIKRIASSAPAVTQEQLDRTRAAVDAAEKAATDAEAEVQQVVDEQQQLTAERDRLDAKRRVDAARARGWELDARRASNGGGGGRRLAGTILLGLGAAALSFSTLDLINADDRLDSHSESSIVIPAGAVSLVAGLSLYVSGELAVHGRRKEYELPRLLVVPDVGRSSVGVSMSMRF